MRPLVQGSASTELSLRLAARRRSEVQALSEAAERLREQGQHEAAARKGALAHALDPQPRLLLAVAQDCRRSALDYEALGIYRRLLQEELDPAHKEQIQAEHQILEAKLEDADAGLPLAIRERLNVAKQAFRNGQFSRAAEEYALAYSGKRLPRVAFNIAQSYRRAGAMELAFLMYQHFKQEDPSSPLRKEAESYLRELASVMTGPPLHKRPWFWGVIGSTAAALIAGGVGIGIAVQNREPDTLGGTRTITFGLTH